MRITLKENLHRISMDSDNKYMKLMMITSLFLKTHQTQRLSETSQYTSLGDGMVSICRKSAGHQHNRARLSDFGE